MTGDWHVERLDSSHQREAFDCGQESLNHFLQRFVGQYERRNLGRSYVVVRSGEKRIVGYYSLAAGSIPLAQLPPEFTKKLPKHPVPVALLARLAVDRSVQGVGIGKLMLLDCLRRCADFSQGLGIHAVEVRAINQAARRFYEKFGFVPLLDDELHLFLPMTTIHKIFPHPGGAAT